MTSAAAPCTCLCALHARTPLHAPDPCHTLRPPPGTIASFHPVSKLAAMLMVPTQIWVTIAAKLNWDIVKLNKGKAKQ